MCKSASVNHTSITYHTVSTMDNSGVIEHLTLEEVLDRNPVGSFQYRLLFMCGLAFMADALEISLLSFLTACVGVDWNLSYSEKATLTGMVFLGIVLGSLFFGRFADAYGRRTSYLYSCLLISCGGLLSAMAPSIYSLIIFRMVTGFGIGGSSVPFDLLAEFLPASHRGKFLAFMQLFWTVGSMLVAAMAWATLPTLGWRFLTFACVLPVILISVYSYFHLPESPRWLMTQHHEQEAAQVLVKAALLNNIRLPAFTLVPKDGEVESESEGAFLDLIRTKAARRITIPLWAIWGLFGFTYFGLVLFQSRVYSNQDSFLHKGNNSDAGALKCEFDYAPLFYNAASESLAVLISIALIDTLGRVKSQVVFYSLGGVAVVCMGLGLSPGAVLFFSIVARMCALSSSLFTWVATPELFPTELRATGHSSCTSISKLCSFCAPYLVNSSASYATVGLVLGCMNIAAAAMACALPNVDSGTLPDTLPNGEIEEGGDKETGVESALHFSHSHHKGHRGDSTDAKGGEIELYVDDDLDDISAHVSHAHNSRGYAKVSTELSSHGYTGKSEYISEEGIHVDSGGGSGESTYTKVKSIELGVM